MLEPWRRASAVYMTVGFSPLACVVLCCFCWRRVFSFQHLGNVYQARWGLDVIRTKIVDDSSRKAILLFEDRVRHGGITRGCGTFSRIHWINSRRLAHGAPEASTGGGAKGGGEVKLDELRFVRGEDGDPRGPRLHRPMDTVHLPVGRGIRVHCLSDIHVDYSSNKQW